VLRDAGLLEQYFISVGANELCVAFRKSGWTLLAQGEEIVAEDLPGQYFGKRGAQWLRLVHKRTGKIVFFMNHHGPLAVNSGGICGGRATAHQLMRIMWTQAHIGEPFICDHPGVAEESCEGFDRGRLRRCG